MDCSSVLFLVMGCVCAQVDKQKLVKRNMTELPYWFIMVQTGSAQPAKNEVKHSLQEQYTVRTIRRNIKQTFKSIKEILQLKTLIISRSAYFSLLNCSLGWVTDPIDDI